MISQYFEDEIKEYLHESHVSFGKIYTPTNSLESDLLNLFTIQKKIIPPVQRIVSVSDELQRKLDDSFKHVIAIQTLREMFVMGLDVNPHQSSNLFNPNVHDDLVYDWSIYHLHLKFTKTQYPYFTDRTKDVLFVLLHGNFAFFIDVMEHSRSNKEVFSDKRLLELVDANWPYVFDEPNGIIDLSHHLTSSERLQCRKGGISEFIVKVNDRLVINPGQGRSTSRHSTEVVMKLNRFLRWISSFENALNSNRLRVDEILINKFGLVSKPRYKLVFTDEGPQIWDINSSKCMLGYHQEIQVVKPS